MADAQSYKRLFPSQEYLTFDGGKDNKFEPTLLPNNESSDCLNVEFVNGSVGTRQGTVKLNTAAAGNVAFDGLYTRRANDGTSESMCAFIGGHMLVLNATTFVTVPSAQSVFTIGARVGCDTAEGYLFIGNGGAGPYKWDGTYFTQHGVPAPVNTALVGSATTGSLTTNGQYVYKYTNVNTHLVESNLGPASVTFAVSSAGLAINVSGIASGATLPSQGIFARYLYRSVNGGGFFRVTKLLDTSTTTYADILADASLGVAAPTDNGTPPLYNAIIYHSNILFCNDAANPNYVWYSTIGQPFTYPSTNFFKVGDNTADLVKGFASYDNYIVIFCEKSTWINYMPDPATPSGWKQVKSNSPYGCKSTYGSVRCNVKGQDVLLHPAVLNSKLMGFGALSGTTLDPSVSLMPVTSAGSDLVSQVIEPDMFNINNSVLGNISAITFKNRAFITVPFGSGQTTNNRVYVWDFSLSNLKKDQEASWVPWSGTGFNIAQFTIYGGNLYGCDSGTTGFVYRLGDTGVYSDDGNAINSYLTTKEYSGNEEDTQLTKDFRYVNMLVDLAGNYYMNITAKVDSDSGSGTSIQVYLNPGGTNWGSVMTWGSSTWGGAKTQLETRVFLGAQLGKRLSLTFSNQNTAGQRFKVHRAQFLYNIRGYR
jgi:hypothetical protein